MKLMGENASVDAIVMKIRTGEKMHNKMKARGYVRFITNTVQTVAVQTKKYSEASLHVSLPCLLDGRG